MPSGVGTEFGKNMAILRSAAPTLTHYTGRGGRGFGSRFLIVEEHHLGTSPGRADRAPGDGRPVSVLLGRGNSPATFLRPGQARGRQQLPISIPYPDCPLCTTIRHSGHRLSQTGG